MAKLVSLKLSKKEQEDQFKPSELPEDRFPFGMRLHLDDDTMSKLSVDFTAGEEVELVAVAKVVTVSKRDTEEGGEKATAELQITDIAFDSGMDDDKKASALFPTKEA